MDSIKVFSPGSVTNVSCGYDILGFCLDNVVDNISTVFDKGKTNLIIGQSGSGKTDEI